jgi:hypothetical protein
MSNATRCAGSASRTQVGDLRLDLGELVRRTGLQARVRVVVVVVVVVSTGLQQVSDFIEGEPQPLRRLDHLQHGDRPPPPDIPGDRPVVAGPSSVLAAALPVSLPVRCWVGRLGP